MQTTDTRSPYSAVSDTVTSNPAAVRDTSDPGDETQRNFRYQHAYGVILLIAGKSGARPYVSIWCEHHDDLLAQRTDDRFDAYQIKTSRPELGAWRMNDSEMVRTIGRFVDLVTEFGDKIGDLFFVSNTDFDRVTPASQDAKRRGRSPELFLQHIRSCDSPTELSPPFDAAFSELQASCGCAPDVLFNVLRKLDLVRGPSRDGFDAVIAHEHLGGLEEFRRLSSDELSRLRDQLVAKVYRASSLHVTDPIRHLRPLLNGTDVDPVIAGKQLDVSATVILQEAIAAPRFSFRGDPTVQLGVPRRTSVLRKKLERGGLDEDQVEDFSDKERAAEAHLMELAHRTPEESLKLLRQLEAMVLSECRAAYLRNRQQNQPFGTSMLIEVQDRLQRLASERPDMVGRQEYECLLGMASLLTSDCRVWWSERFPIDEEAA